MDHVLDVKIESGRDQVLQQIRVQTNAYTQLEQTARTIYANMHFLNVIILPLLATVHLVATTPISARKHSDDDAIQTAVSSGVGGASRFGGGPGVSNGVISVIDK